MTTYYDIILGLIPLALLGITGTLAAAGFTLTTAVPIAALVAVALIGHALFVRGPVDQPPTASSTNAPASQSSMRATE